MTQPQPPASSEAPAGDLPAGWWRPLAACRGLDPELFFTRKGESTAEAKAVCDSCPVEGPCLVAALEAGEKFGVWGGLSERERRRLRRRLGLRLSGRRRGPGQSVRS